jgi:hypothetical protein
MKILTFSLKSIAAGIIIAFTSCTEPIDIELDNDYARLTVFGEISTDTTVHSIRLTRSADYFYNKPAEGIPGASVRISDGVNEIILSESQLIQGNYETPPDFFGIPGKSYDLYIENVDINGDGEDESYSASSFLPFLASIDSIQIKYVDEGSEVQLYARDPAESIDFYAFKVKRNNVLQTDSLPEIHVQNDIFFNGSYTNGVTVQSLDDAKEGEKVVEGDTIVFEMFGITEEYYNFIIEAQTELFGSNPLFSGPPANISTNLSNGALGFFAAVNIKRSATIAPQKQ